FETVTQSDCYVTLWLPTASMKKEKTHTVKDNKDPVWNESFHYRIQNQVKNILELQVCDEDKHTEDDHLLTVFFDVSKIHLGETVRLNFQLNPKGKEELEVEFTLESSPDVPEKIVTNGALVSREVACLEVQVDNGRMQKDSTQRRFNLSVGGSHEGPQELTLRNWLCPASPVKFHYIKYFPSELDIELPRWLCSASGDPNEIMSVPLNSLPMKENVTAPQNKTFELDVTSKDWTEGWLWKTPKQLDVRLDYDLCSDEKIFLKKRKKVVAAALKGCLQLEHVLQENEVSALACGRTMTKLYEDADWSNKDLGEIIKFARKQAAKSKMSAFSLESLKNYHNELCQRTTAGYKTSFIDLWGLMVEAMLNDGNNNHKLSDQRKAANRGQNPLPIYLALNVKDKVPTRDFREWVEFTPYEVGFPKYGAFVRAEDFGSQFYMGHLMKKLPESRICFMQGMWSSIFSKNLLDAWHAAENSEDFWNRWTQDTITEIEEVPDLPERPHDMPTSMFTPAGGLSRVLRDILTDRPAVSKYDNFLKGFQMNNEYSQHRRFSKWKDSALDSTPNRLRDPEEHLELVDTAFFFDTSCPPLLRPERKVDVILHFNYTGGSQTKPLEQASSYFSEQGIPFPKTMLNDEEKKNLKECYVFEDPDNPDAPIVVYFPLVNDTFQRYVAPGMERSAAEMSLGNIDISSAFSPYSTRQVSLQEEDFNKLLNLTNYNVQNNANTIFHVFQKAVERKKQSQSSQT
ncbi:PREDICTED: cytosolic phospholipase A2 epsilon-like, partial [Gekko japonicus]|uniref:Phospholipase A2 n=1 Tax=Gekko japonicus TaxID=146911 RepID=A0ABM1JMG7_GEKJA